MKKQLLALPLSLTIATLSITLNGCATPKVVETKQINDDNLSCREIEQAKEEAINFENNARGEREATGTNVAAAIFFWPGLLATYSNTEDAINAAKERQDHLMKLYASKGCSSNNISSPGNSISEELIKLKRMHDEKLISTEEYNAAKKKLLNI